MNNRVKIPAGMMVTRPFETAELHLKFMVALSWMAWNKTARRRHGALVRYMRARRDQCAILR